MNNLGLLSVFFLFLFINTGVSQNINRDSLLQIISDTTIEYSERRKAGQIILTYHKQLLSSKFDTKIVADSIYSIENEILLFKNRTDSLVNILYETILNADEAEQNRKKSIDILIDIDDEKNLRFLVEHLGQIYFPLMHFGADNEFDSYYIFKSLHKKASNNWKLIPIIINALESKKSEIEILLLSALLRQILEQDSELYSSIINIYLAKSSGYMKYNLGKLK